MSRSIRWSWLRRALVALLSLTPAVAVADVESDLRARLRGRSAIVLSAVASECTEHYSDNQAAGGYASGSGPVQLPAGELATIDNVHIGWTRFDVNLTLVTPFRVPIVDGPFQLFEHRPCRVQLAFDVPRDVRKDLDRAEATVLAILEVHPSPDAARASGSWNGREPEPLPADSEERWAEYRVWKAAQVNVEIRRKLDTVLADAQAALRNMRDDAEYLESFALGAASRRYDSTSSCDALLSASFYPSGSGGKSSRGYADGQRVAWSLNIARGLQGCWVEVLPGG
ncbi:MAG: hypothetical protein F9K18_06775 [Thermoanaerobaculia bacterium]|nr:MAG: hypothetical protein F9K18_06775 [Thermoanaerobaculia bacterium]MBZ0103970.1 hypothetical protein [Thermoanaerobaculia bacterium]